MALISESTPSVLRQILVYYSEYHANDDAYVLPFRKRHYKDCIVDHLKYELSKNKHLERYTKRRLRTFSL
ncbi:MAG: hypothetical protein AB1540_16075 [Bdellovibrionota bacterium]